jgi:hypothetical protein
MSNLDKSGEREIAARITAETYKVEAAIQAALELINEPSAELIASCENGLAGAKNLREFFADWLFDASQHCHTCFEVANLVVDTCHADSHLCRECLIGENDPKAIAFFLQG